MPIKSYYVITSLRDNVALYAKFSSSKEFRDFEWARDVEQAIKFTSIDSAKEYIFSKIKAPQKKHVMYSGEPDQNTIHPAEITVHCEIIRMSDDEIKAGHKNAALKLLSPEQRKALGFD